MELLFQNNVPTILRSLDCLDTILGILLNIFLVIELESLKKPLLKKMEIPSSYLYLPVSQMLVCKYMYFKGTKLRNAKVFFFFIFRSNFMFMVRSVSYLKHFQINGLQTYVAVFNNYEI